MILNCTTAATELRAAPNDNFGLIAKIVVITVLSHTHDCLDKSSSKVKRRKKEIYWLIVENMTQSSKRGV